jgi:hypothetical protein
LDFFFDSQIPFARFSDSLCSILRFPLLDSRIPFARVPFSQL